jgi:hypothetical protein
MAVVAPIIMGIGSLVQGGMSLYGANKEAAALREQGEYRNKIGQINANLANEQATDAIKRGEQDTFLVRDQAAKVQGAQQVAFAASGVDSNSGSAADVQRESQIAASMDVTKIRNNAHREAWGYRVQADNATREGRLAQIAGNNAADSTLITGGIKGLGSVFEAANQFSKFGGSAKSVDSTTPSRPPKASYKNGFGGKGYY